MAPKKKVASKTKKVAPKTLEDMPNVTKRRQYTLDVNEIENGDIKNTSLSENPSDLNNTVNLENNSEPIIIESDDSEILTDIDDKIKKVDMKKTKQKSKKKTSEDDVKIKKTRKRAVSVENQTMKVESTKSRKRPGDKDNLEHTKSVLPINELRKRNRRAASVDLISEISSTHVPKKTGKVETSKNKKTVKDEPKLIEKKMTKRMIKKEVTSEDEEKQEELVDEPNNLESHPILDLKGVVIEKLDQKDLQNKKEKIPVQISRNQEKSKVQQDEGKDLKKKRTPISKPNEKSPEISNENNITDDPDVIIISPELNKKLIDKLDIKFSGKSEESTKINDSNDDSVNLVIPESREKRVRRGKKIDIDYKEPEIKEFKMPRRGGRKGKDVDKKVLEKIPTDQDEIPTGDLPNLPDGLSNTSESQKNEIKPTVNKRKTKAKIIKK